MNNLCRSKNLGTCICGFLAFIPRKERKEVWNSRDWSCCWEGKSKALSKTSYMDWISTILFSCPLLVSVNLSSFFCFLPNQTLKRKADKHLLASVHFFQFCVECSCHFWSNKWLQIFEMRCGFMNNKTDQGTPLRSVQVMASTENDLKWNRNTQETTWRFQPFECNGGVKRVLKFYGGRRLIFSAPFLYSPFALKCSTPQQI